MLELQAGPAAEVELHWKSYCSLRVLPTEFCFFIVLENNTCFYLSCRLNTARERKNVDTSAVSTFLLCLLHVHRTTGIVCKHDGEFCDVYGRNRTEMNWVKETNRT